MTKLSVNINKVATLRNARGGNTPNVLQVAKDCVRFGAEGITVHPRPDERHIRYQDVFDIAEAALPVEFNIEGNPKKGRFLEVVRKVRPAQATLVPDEEGAITSNAGWDTVTHKAYLQEVVGELKSLGVRVSLFLDPIPERVEVAAEVGADRIELYTEDYAKQYAKSPWEAIKPYHEAALVAANCNLGLNAGHDLSLENLRFLAENLPGLAEVSIGHALMADALYFGLESTIQKYLAELKV